MQFAAPEVLKVSVGHAMQTVDEVLPLKKLKVSAGQEIHAELPFDGLYVPGGQIVHVTAVAPPAEKLPTWHGPVP